MFTPQWVGVAEGVHITMGGCGGGCLHHSGWVWHTNHYIVMAETENIHTMVAGMAVGFVEPDYIMAD